MGSAPALLHWLALGALDGALFAAAGWLASRSVLRRASGRVQAWLWRGVLLQFVLVRPFELPALPLQGEVTRALQADVQSAGAGFWSSAVAGVYALIVLSLLARSLVAERGWRRRIAGYPLAEAAVTACVRAAGAALSLSVLPEVRVTDEPLAPFTLGRLRPVLVLPRWLCVPGERLELVSLHELAHLKRRDHWWLALERAVAYLFFFWPPVHWVSRRLDLARELACDERALERGGCSAAHYGSHLVDVVRAARQRITCAGALAIGHGSSRLEQRIDRLIALTGARRSRSLEAAALLALGASSLLALRPLPELAGVAPLPASSGATDSPGENQCWAVPEEPLPSCAQRALQL